MITVATLLLLSTCTEFEIYQHWDGVPIEEQVLEQNDFHKLITETTPTHPVIVAAGLGGIPMNNKASSWVVYGTVGFDPNDHPNNREELIIRHVARVDGSCAASKANPSGTSPFFRHDPDELFGEGKSNDDDPLYEIFTGYNFISYGGN